MSVADRAKRARLLWDSGDREGALEQLLLGIAATSRKRYPKSRVRSDREAFIKFVEDEIVSGLFFGPHLKKINFAMPWRGKSLTLAEILYEIRCSTVHEGVLPADVHYAPGGDPHQLVLKVDDATNAFVFEDALLRCLNRCVHNVPENAGELKPLPLNPVTGISVTGRPSTTTITCRIITLPVC